MIYSSFSSSSMDSDGNNDYSLTQRLGNELDTLEYSMNNDNGNGSIMVKMGDDIVLDEIFASESELNELLNDINALNMELGDNIELALVERREIKSNNLELNQILNEVDDIDAEEILQIINEGDVDIEYLDNFVTDEISKIESNEGIAESALGISPNIHSDEYDVLEPIYIKDNENNNNRITYLDNDLDNDLVEIETDGISESALGVSMPGNFANI